MKKTSKSTNLDTIAKCHQHQKEEVQDLRQLQDGQLPELRHMQGHEVFWRGRKN
jgi:hypothetical protein